MVVIRIENGEIRGKICETDRGKRFFSFQNIPYAAPPIGHLRFKTPTPPKSWNGIRDATQEGNECLSKHMLTKQTVGSEDCLILNVYTPQIPDGDRNLKPVMFWIHGGVFSTGSSKTELFGPEFLLNEDIVLITINYRLGILGFLSLDDPILDVPGNAAFKDMVMALKWVQTNIKQFCGDPTNVTIFGESAGASAAHLLMLSPMANGLLHKIIAQSGTALNRFVFGRRSAKLIANKLGFHNTDDRKLLNFLQNAPATDILNAQLLIDADDFLVNEPRHFGAVIEHSSTKEPFLSEDPIDIILSGNYHHVPLIMGYTSAEGIIFDLLVRPSNRDYFVKDFEIHVPHSLNIQKRTRKSIELANKIKHFYFGDGEVDRIKCQHEFYQMVTDFGFFWPIYASIKYHRRTAKLPIYLYKMSIETDLNIFKIQSGVQNMPGACHADDLFYLFKTIFTPEITPNSIEELAQKRIIKMWTNFARCNKPTIDSKLFPFIDWKPVERSTFYYLDIDRELTLKDDPESERRWFLEEIFERSTPNSKL